MYMAHDRQRLKMTAARSRLGWSQSELSRQSGVNQTTISLIESGRLRPYPAQLEKIARALGWPLDEADRLVEAADPEHSDHRGG